MPREPKGGKEHTFQMRCSMDFMERVDEWRRGQRDLPSRAEAIRRIVTAALDIHENGSTKEPDTAVQPTPRKKRSKDPA